MPTKRTRVSRAMVPEVSEVMLHFLSDQLFPLPKDSEDDIIDWLYFTTREEKENIWTQCQDVIIEAWVNVRPGTRPSLWWKIVAPEKSRRRLGGVGTAAFEVLAYAEEYHCGLPITFIDEFDADYYNGLARDVNGNRIGTEFTDGSFPGRAIDQRNPPQYESQAAYLRRNGLLTESEKRRLKPRNFRPEKVVRDDSIAP